MSRHPGQIAIVLAVLVVLAGCLGGCAYYNTFYNAQQAYTEAEEAGKDADPRLKPTAAQRPKYQLCINKCQLLLEEHPNSGYVDDALFLMAKCQFALKDYRNAIRNFDNVMANFPNSQFVEEALFLEAVAYLELGEEQDSLDAMRRLRERYPNSKFAVEALYRLGDSYANNEKYEQAINYYAEFTQNNPNHEETGRVLYDSGDILMKLERYEEAADVLADAASEGDTRELKFEAQLMRVRALNESGQSEEAAEQLEDIRGDAARFEKRGETLVLEGQIQLELGNEDDGISILTSVADEFRGEEFETEARYYMAEYYLRSTGPANSAIVTQLQAAIDDGARGDYADDVRELRQQMGRYRGLFTALSEPDSNSWGDAFQMAELLYLDLDQPEMALNYYQMVLDDYPDCPMAPRAAYAIGFIQAEVFNDDQASQVAYDLLDDRYADSPQALALGGAVFLDPKPRELGELATGAPAPPGPGGDLGVAPPPPGRDLLPGERPALDGRRSLREGGPGALTPRTWGTR